MNHLFDLLVHLEKTIEQLAALHPLLTFLLMFGIVYVETAFFPASPLLPGDGLLFAVGILASDGTVSLWLALPVLILAGVLGNQTGYLIGRKIGATAFLQKGWLSESNYQKTVSFYYEQGNWAMFLSRFLPVIRAIVPFVAGIAAMNPKKFTALNLISVAVWVLSITLIANYLGTNPFVREHFTGIIFGMVAAGILLMLFVNLRKQVVKKD